MLNKKARGLLADSLQSGDPIEREAVTVKSSRRTLVRETLLEYLETHGVHHLTLADIFTHLQQALPPHTKPPCLSSLAAMLRNDFHLRFRAAAPALVRYVDPTYNHKREWASRLLA